MKPTQPNTRIVRYSMEGSERWGVLREDGLRPLEMGLSELLRLPHDQAKGKIEECSAGEPVTTESPRLLAPIDRQEVWASGVTYHRSLEGRTEESDHASLYDRVYESARPELFLKSTPERTVGPGEPVGIRIDSSWDVPEPELGLVLASDLSLFAYTIGNDMSSRSIEGENALYLPQAKFYDRACSLGPHLVPAWEVSGPFSIALTIEREGTVILSEKTSTERLARDLNDLASWLGRATSFPDGAVLLTGTGIVPEAGFSLAAGDLVVVAIDRVGELRNPVVNVGIGDGQ